MERKIKESMMKIFYVIICFSLFASSVWAQMKAPKTTEDLYYQIEILNVFTEKIANGDKKLQKILERDAFQKMTDLHRCAFLRIKAFEGDKEAEKILNIISEEYLTGLKQKAEKGDFSSIVEIAFAYLEGTFGVTPNSTEAFRWMKKAADRGSPMAQDTVGQMYQTALGTPRDLKKALEYTIQASENNWPGAHFNTAMMYFYGEGAPMNFEKAVIYAQKGTMVGDKKAKYFMEHLAEKKEIFIQLQNNPKRELEKAMQDLKTMATFGYPQKQYEAGLIYLPFAIMGKESYEESLKWLTKAAIKGHERAAQALSDLKNLDPKNPESITRLFQYLDDTPQFWEQLRPPKEK